MIELIEIFIRPLHEQGIRYFITGSVASMVYGEPRLTNDVDVVLEITDSNTLSAHIAQRHLETEWQAALALTTP
jgi:hypothetical protein